MNDYQLSEMVKGCPRTSKFLLLYGLCTDLTKYVSDDVYILMYNGLRVPIANALDSVVKVNLKNS